MLELIATGPEPGQEWRRQIPSGKTIRLGRAPLDGWAVPWDLRISRDHADLFLEAGTLKVCCLDSARNSAYLHNRPRKEFPLRPGDEFRIGQTYFRLQGNVGMATVVENYENENLDSGDFRSKKLSPQSQQDAQVQLLTAEVESLRQAVTDAQRNSSIEAERKIEEVRRQLEEEAQQRGAIESQRYSEEEAGRKAVLESHQRAIEAARRNADGENQKKHELQSKQLEEELQQAAAAYGQREETRRSAEAQELELAIEEARLQTEEEAQQQIIELQQRLEEQMRCLDEEAKRRQSAEESHLNEIADAQRQAAEDSQRIIAEAEKRLEEESQRHDEETDSLRVELEALKAAQQKVEETSRLQADDEIHRRQAEKESAELRAKVEALQAQIKVEDDKSLQSQLTESEEPDKVTSNAGSSIDFENVNAPVLGEYYLLNHLAACQTGQIYKSQHRTTGSIVALKTLSEEAVASPELLTQFRQRVAVLTRLGHPNLVTAFAADEQDGTHFLTMEFIEGNDVFSLAREQDFSIEKAVNYAAQVATGLSYLHANGIVHRNVSPDNLLVNRQGVVKVIGLGSALFPNDSTQAENSTGEVLEGESHIIGSLDFIAPEQAKGSSQADARSDIYSLGCTIFLMVTGQYVFPNKSPREKIIAHRDLPPPKARALRSDISENLDAVCQRMMSKDPAHRFQTMDEVIAVLQSIHEGLTASTRPPLPPTHIVGESASRNKRLFR